MAYQYPHGGASPIIPHAVSPVPRAVTPTIPIPGAQAGPIQPGSITYTTTVGPDGQLIYHPFKAVAASYETPQGIVSGIQWVPAEATRMIPSGATPATADILASFSRSAANDPYRTGEWQRDDDRRRRKEDEREYRREEKERRRLEREEERLEKELRRARERDSRDDRRQSSGYAYERDLDRFRDLGISDRERDREQRERDREYEREQAKARSRRGSMYGGADPAYPAAAPGYPAAAGGAYPTPTSPYAAAGPAPYPPTAPYGGAPGSVYAPPPVRPASGIQRPVSPYQPGAIPPPRSASPYYAPPPAQQRPASPYQPVPGALPRAASPYAVPGALPRAPSPYGPRPASPYGAPQPRTSPYQSTAVQPGAVYPPGHVLEGQPLQRALSRAPSPAPGAYTPAPGGAYGGTAYGAPQPGYALAGTGAMGAAVGVGGYPAAVPGAGAGYGAVAGQEQQPMPAPEGFARPPNLAQPYTRFETLKIQDMDDFFENIPRMPLVLVPHDVYHEDWIRLMTDLSLAWAGKLPVPEYARDGRPPKRTVLTSDLIDLWNASFFLKRGVEVVLYKGRERRSGRAVGTVDVHLPGFEHAPGSDSSESESSDSEDDDDDERDRYRYGAYGGVYGRQQEAALSELHEAKRLRRERKKAEKKRRKLEKKQRRKQREAERKYALYITCVTPEP